MVASTPNKATQSAVTLEQYAIQIISSPFGNGKSDPSSSSSLKNLSQLLISHGFISRPLCLEGLDEYESERVVRCFWAVLSARADALSSLSSLSSAHQVLNYDLSRSQTLLNQSLENQAHLETEFEATKSKVDKLQKDLAQEASSHKSTKEDLAKARSALTYVKTQTSLTIRRHEQLSASIAQKYQQLSSLSSAASTTVRILNPAVKDGFPAPTSGGPVEVELLEESLRDAEARASRERVENRDLRVVLREVKDWSTLVRKSDFEVDDLMSDPDIEDVANLDAHVLSVRVHQELFHLRELIVALLEEKKEKFKVVESEFKEMQKGWEAEKDSLSNELQEAKEQLDRANEMVEAFISAEALHGNPVLSNPRLGGAPNLGDETTDGLDDEMTRQRNLLEEERQKFMEAAVRLGKERTEFEAEKISFYEERRKIQVQLMLSNLPDTPLSAKVVNDVNNAERIGPKVSRRVSIASPLIAKRTKSPPPIAVPTFSLKKDGKDGISKLKNILAMATESQDIPLTESPDPTSFKDKDNEKQKRASSSKGTSVGTHTTTVVSSRRTSSSTTGTQIRKSNSPVERLSKPLDRGPTKPLVLSSGEEKKGLQMRKRSNSTAGPPPREIPNISRTRKVSVGPGVTVREKEKEGLNGTSKIGSLRRSASIHVSSKVDDKSKDDAHSRKASTHVRAASSTLPAKKKEEEKKTEKDATDTRSRKTSILRRSASTSVKADKKSMSATDRVKALVKKAAESSS